MKRGAKALLSLYFLFLGLIFVSPTPQAAAADYEISRYDVTVELVPDEDGELRNTAVTLLVTYDIQSGPKSEGFKFVGTLPLQDVSVTDGNGVALRHQVEHLKENKITWYFDNALSQGKQTVIVHFKLVGALTGNLESNSLTFDWVKNWKVPVHNVTYRFVLPSDYQYDDLSMTPTDSSKPHGVVICHERRCIENHLEQLPNRPLKISFSPGVAKAASSSIFFNILTGIFGILVIAVFIFFAKKMATSRIFRSRGGNSGGCGGCGGGCGGCGGGCGGCGG